MLDVDFLTVVIFGQVSSVVRVGPFKKEVLLKEVNHDVPRIGNGSQAEESGLCSRVGQAMQHPHSATPVPYRRGFHGAENTTRLYHRLFWPGPYAPVLL